MKNTNENELPSLEKIVTLMVPDLLQAAIIFEDIKILNFLKKHHTTEYLKNYLEKLFAVDLSCLFLVKKSSILPKELKKLGFNLEEIYKKNQDKLIKIENYRKEDIKTAIAPAYKLKMLGLKNLCYETMTTDFESKNNFLSHAILNFKNSLELALNVEDPKAHKNYNDILRFLLTAWSIYQDKEKNGIDKYLIEKFEKTKNWEMLGTVYTELFNFNFENQNLLKAINYAKMAHELLLSGKFSLNKEEEKMGDIYYNFALTLKDFRPEDASHLLKFAKCYSPNDKDVQKTIEHVNLISAETFSVVSSNCNNNDKTTGIRKKAATLTHEIIKKKQKNINQKEILKFLENKLKESSELISAENIILQYQLFLTYRANAKTKEADRAFEVISDLLSKFPFDIEYNSNAWKAFNNCLAVYVHDSIDKKDFSKPLGILEKFITYEKNHVSYRYEKIKELKFIIDLLKKYEFPKEEIIQESAEIFENAEQNLTLQKEIKELKIEVNEKSFTPTPIVLIDQKNEIPAEKQEVAVNVQDIEKKTDLVTIIQQPVIPQPKTMNLAFEDISLLIESGNAEVLANPKILHKYFRIQKKIILSQGKTINNNNDNLEITWEIDDVVYTTKQNELNSVTKVEKINHHFKANNYFAVIHHKIAKILDNKVFKICNKALENGVKFIKNGLNNSIIELWTKDDLRLTTTKIYKEEGGKCLIVFDESGTHMDVKKNLGKLQFIDLSSDAKEISLQGLNDFDED